MRSEDVYENSRLPTVNCRLPTLVGQGLSAPMDLFGYKIERVPQHPRQSNSVIVRPEVHEQQTRLLVDHVTVQGDDLDTTTAQRPPHRRRQTARETGQLLAT